MPKPINLSRETFEDLLRWLAPDKEVAAARYQEVHRKLVRHFAFKGCTCPEDLADKVMDRVAKKVRFFDSSLPWQEDRVGIFYSYTKYVYLEYVRTRIPVAPAPLCDAASLEKHHNCLEKCMLQLVEPDRQLLLDYYKYAPGQKIDHRKALAETRQMPLNALRIRVCRLRAGIKDCVVDCVQAQGADWVQ